MIESRNQFPLHNDNPKGLFVAGRGTGPGDGLHRYEYREGNWQGRHIATVADLSALAAHPSLSVIYGVSGVSESGKIHAWDVSAEGARPLGCIESKGNEPCHVAVAPSGRLLVVTHYASGTIAVQRLAMDGSFDREPELIVLTGGSVDIDRQEGAHPHQALFDGDRLYVVDLGADLVRYYDVVWDDAGEPALNSVGSSEVPSGTGPRHTVTLPDGRLVISGELASSVLFGGEGRTADDWSITSSTVRTGPAITRSERNYPGDIQRSADGRLIICANRGYDTVSTFAVEGASLRLVSETSAGVAWPQHLLMRDEELLVAGWDSSTVVSIPLLNGLPGEPRLLFNCAGAAWLLAAER